MARSHAARSTPRGLLPVRRRPAARVAAGVSASQPRRRLPVRTTAPKGVQAVLAEPPSLEPEEMRARRMVYLVTLPHPRRKRSACGVALVEPQTLTKAAVAEALLDACARPEAADVGNRAQAHVVALESCVVADERHLAGANGVAHGHKHIAVKAQKQFMFLPVKRALLKRHGLASHWSCSHTGYASAVRYLVWPSPRKPRTALDPAPYTWARVGKHPRLLDAKEEPTTSLAIRARMEAAQAKAAEAGKAEPRPSEMDVWPLVVMNNVRHDASRGDAYLQLVDLAKRICSPAMVAFLFRIRKKLPSLIEDIWTWETVSDRLATSALSRPAALDAALQQPCVCGGQWVASVRASLDANGIDAVDLGHHIGRSFLVGRSETTPVVVLAGLQGGEGKSLVFLPLPAVVGQEFVQASPVKGSFPLLGLEHKKVVLLDDWHFHQHALPLSLQLLWYEGKPVPIARPQGRDGEAGHLLYTGSAPIFVTTPLKRIEQMEQSVEQATAEGTSSPYSMLLRRVRVYRFRVRVPPPPAQIPPCAHCFAWYLYDAEAEWCRRA